MGEIRNARCLLLQRRWRQYADPWVDPICRSQTGSITPIMTWILYADHHVDPIRRSLTCESSISSTTKRGEQRMDQGCPEKTRTNKTATATIQIKMSAPFAPCRIGDIPIAIPIPAQKTPMLTHEVKVPPTGVKVIKAPRSAAITPYPTTTIH